MTNERVRRIAKYATPGEVSQWENGVKMFVSHAHPQLSVELMKTCNECPFRNNSSAGGCGGKDCPVYAVNDALAKAAKRAKAIAKRIHESQIGLKTKAIYG